MWNITSVDGTIHTGTKRRGGTVEPTLVEMAQSMMIHAGVSVDLWAEAICTSVYVRNLCPTRNLDNKTL